MNKEKMTNIKFTILAVICLVMLGIALAPKTLQNDTYYTIKIGEYIEQNGISNLKNDPFSWHEGLPYTFPHWLYDLGIYLIYKVGSFEGIYLSTVILSAILGVSMYAVNVVKSKNRFISLIIAFGGLYLMSDYITARAQLVTFILFIFTIIFIEKFMETNKKRYIIPLIIIPILIANLHLAVWPFYFVLYLPYIVEYLFRISWELNLITRFSWIVMKALSKIIYKGKLNTIINDRISLIERKMKKTTEVKIKLDQNPYKLVTKKNKYDFIIIIVFIICIFTGLLTPVGDAPYTYLYKTLIGNTTKSINEHLPLTLMDNTNFMLVIFSFLIILIFTDTKIRLRDALMLGGLLYLSFKTRRQISMFIIMCSPILCTLLKDMFKANESHRLKSLMNYATSIFGILILIGLSLYVSLDKYKPKMEDEYVDKATYPVAASDWILENLDVNNIKLYNQYNYGSYLLYRGIPVFIDSRADLYAPEFNTKTGKREDGKDIFSDALNIDGCSVDYNKKFEEYGVTHAIVYSSSRLVSEFKNDNRYKLIYQDDYFNLYERLTPKLDEN